MSNTISSSPVRSGLSYAEAERKIRKLHRAASGDVTEGQSRTLYSLELQASRHGGDSPRSLLEKAKAVLIS